MDARAGPGIKSSMKIKNNKSPSSSKYKSPLKSKKMYPHNIPSSIYDMSGTTIQKKSLRAPSHLLHHAARCLSVSGFYILNYRKLIFYQTIYTSTCVDKIGCTLRYFVIVWMLLPTSIAQIAIICPKGLDKSSFRKLSEGYLQWCMCLL